MNSIFQTYQSSFFNHIILKMIWNKKGKLDFNSIRALIYMNILFFFIFGHNQMNKWDIGTALATYIVYFQHIVMWKKNNNFSNQTVSNCLSLWTNAEPSALNINPPPLFQYQALFPTWLWRTLCYIYLFLPFSASVMTSITVLPSLVINGLQFFPIIIPYL